MTTQDRKINIIDEILTIPEASELCGRDVSTLSRVITRRNGKFIEGIDWRRANNTIIVSKESIQRVYGTSSNPKSPQVGVTTRTFEREFGVKRVGKRWLSLSRAIKMKGRRVERVVYYHEEHGEIAKLQNVWFKVDGDVMTDEYVESDSRLYERGLPDMATLKKLGLI